MKSIRTYLLGGILAVTLAGCAARLADWRQRENLSLKLYELATQYEHDFHTPQEISQSTILKTFPDSSRDKFYIALGDFVRAEERGASYIDDDRGKMLIVWKTIPVDTPGLWPGASPYAQDAMHEIFRDKDLNGKCEEYIPGRLRRGTYLDYLPVDKAKPCGGKQKEFEAAEREIIFALKKHEKRIFSRRIVQ